MSENGAQVVAADAAVKNDTKEKQQQPQNSASQRPRFHSNATSKPNPTDNSAGGDATANGDEAAKKKQSNSRRNSKSGKKFFTGEGLGGGPRKSISDGSKPNNDSKGRGRIGSVAVQKKDPNAAQTRPRAHTHSGKNNPAKSASQVQNWRSGDNKPLNQNNDKRRALSTATGGKSLDAGGDKKGDDKQRYQSNASNGRNRNRTSNSATSNGESFEYDDYDLDEPFSDSDEESPFHREVQKPSLQIPRGRIRTLSGTVPVIGYSPRWGGPTMCLSCLQFFDLPDEVSKFADHLLAEHQIVVEEMELIVDPKRYIEYWRQRLAKEDIAKLLPKIVPDEKSPYHGKAEYYFEISERIPEDYGCRQRLAMRRLEEALACQQREREDVTFSMQCIFCRYVARGNRAKLIHHLYMIHHLNLGSPDNLVFVNEYLEYLRDQLQRNECIYCEKVFADRNILMDHMRKRNHREVNPKNRWLDRFYVINYLEVGKRWLEVLAEDFEDTMPAFQDSDEEEEEESWNEWLEDNTDEDQLRVICLFCDDSHDKVTSLLHHLNEAHKFDLIGYIEKEKLDVFGRMKLLNHIRKEIFNTPNFRAKVQENNGVIEVPEREKWDIEEELVPMFANDHLLWMLESYLDEQRPELAGHEVTVAADVPAAERLIAESKANTVNDVHAEDMPPLHDDETENEEFKELIQAVRSTSLD